MPHLDKGKIFLKVASHAAIMSLGAVPVVGALINIGRECWQILLDEQEKAAMEDRVAQLEQAAVISPEDARQMAMEAIQEARSRGVAIDLEKAEAIKDIMSAMPSRIRERTNATLTHARRMGTALATVLPITRQFASADREVFYTNLFPQRRPLFRAGDALPNGNPEWRLERLLGVGSFGEVWLAKRDPVPNQPSLYAVKFCQNVASGAILKREKDNLQAIQSKLPTGTSHIAALLEMQLKTMPYWLAFEYIDGGTLENRIQLGAMNWPAAWELFRHLVAGMAKVHKLGLVHRDLKPANILLAGGTQPRITDFGIGKILAEQITIANKVNQEFTVVGYGTSGYMSSEQEEGQPAHPADDVYALGVILWQMLTGKLKPLKSPDVLGDLKVPAQVKAVISDCVFKSRARRIPSAQILLERLEKIRAKQPVKRKFSLVLIFFILVLLAVAWQFAPLPTLLEPTEPLIPSRRIRNHFIGRNQTTTDNMADATNIYDRRRSAWMQCSEGQIWQGDACIDNAVNTMRDTFMPDVDPMDRMDQMYDNDPPPQQESDTGW